MHDPSPEPQYNPLVEQCRSCMNLMTIDRGTSHPIVHVFAEFEGVYKAARITQPGYLLEGR